MSARPTCVAGRAARRAARRAAKRAAARLLGALCLVLVLDGGCTRPCEADADCPTLEHCGPDRVCTAQCVSSLDCARSEICQRGRCEISYVPGITWLEPAEDAQVGERFDVVAEVRFRGPELVAVLTRDPAEPGEACAPMIVQELRVEGTGNGESVRELVFRDVPSLGSRFRLQLDASAGGIESRARRRLRGEVIGAFGGADILAPREDVLDADDAYSQTIQARFEPAAGLVSGWVEPEGTPPSPRFVLGQGASEILDRRLPLARGPQVVWIETERAGRVERCGVGLTTAPPAVPGDLEVALSYESDEPTNLDLWLQTEPLDGDPSTCTLSAPERPCLEVREGARGLAPYGEEALYLEAVDGVYGVAVRPGAATGPVRATVRLANRGVHLGWLGPRTVQADRGEVWLAARIYVLGGEIRVEPVDRVSIGVPAAPPTGW